MFVLLVVAASSASVAVSHHHDSGAPVDECATGRQGGPVGEGAEPSAGCAPASLDEALDRPVDAPVVAGCAPEPRD